MARVSCLQKLEPVKTHVKQQHQGSKTAADGSSGSNQAGSGDALRGAQDDSDGIKMTLSAIPVKSVILPMQHPTHAMQPATDYGRFDESQSMF